MDDEITVEFTIEPFVAGQIPAHVTAAVAALERLGLSPVLGPFGTSFTVAAGEVGDAVAALVDAAYANGATHVSLDTGRV